MPETLIHAPWEIAIDMPSRDPVTIEEGFSAGALARGLSYMYIHPKTFWGAFTAVRAKPAGPGGPIKGGVGVSKEQGSRGNFVLVCF